MNAYDRLYIEGLQSSVADDAEKLAQASDKKPYKGALGAAKYAWDRYSSGANATIAAPAFGLAEGIANAAGMDKTAEFFANRRGDAEAYAADVEQRNPRHTFSDAQTVGDYLKAGGDALLENAPQLVVGGLAAKGGALAAGAIGRGLGLAGSSLNKAQVAGALTGGAAQNIGTEAGMIYNDQADGKKDLGRAFLYGVPAGLVETGAEAFTVARSGLGKYIADTAKDSALPALAKGNIGKITKDGLKTVGLGSLSEGTEELIQNPLEHVGAGKSIFDANGNFNADLKRSMYEGFMGGAFIGAGLGGAGHAYSTMQQKQAIGALASGQTDAKTRQDLAANVSLGLDDSQKAEWQQFSNYHIENGLDMPQANSFMREIEMQPLQPADAAQEAKAAGQGALGSALVAGKTHANNQLGRYDVAISGEVMPPALGLPAPAQVIDGEYEQVLPQIAGSAQPQIGYSPDQSANQPGQPLIEGGNQLSLPAPDNSFEAQDGKGGWTGRKRGAKAPAAQIPALTIDQIPAALEASGFSPDHVGAVVSHLKQVVDYGNSLISKAGGKPETSPVFTHKDIQDAIDAVVKSANPPAAPQYRRGLIGDKLSSGEVVTTATGRQTTPFPSFKALDTNRKITSATKNADNWLIDNAIAEAESRGDDFNLTQFKAINRKNIAPSDRDSAEMYLFGEEQPPVAPKILKPMGGTDRAPVTTATNDSSAPKAKEGGSASVAVKTGASSDPADPRDAAAHTLVEGKRKPPVLYTVPDEKHHMTKYVFADDGKKVSVVKPDGTISPATPGVTEALRRLIKSGDAQAYQTEQQKTDEATKVKKNRLKMLETKSKKKALTEAEQQEVATLTAELNGENKETVPALNDENKLVSDETNQANSIAPAVSHEGYVTSALETQGFETEVRNNGKNTQVQLSWKGMPLLLAQRMVDGLKAKLQFAVGLQQKDGRQTAHKTYNDYMWAEMEFLSQHVDEVHTDLLGEGSHAWFAANIPGAENLKRGNTLIIKFTGEKQFKGVESTQTDKEKQKASLDNSNKWDTTNTPSTYDPASFGGELGRVYEVSVPRNTYDASRASRWDTRNDKRAYPGWDGKGGSESLLSALDGLSERWTPNTDLEGISEGDLNNLNFDDWGEEPAAAPTPAPTPEPADLTNNTGKGSKPSRKKTDAFPYEPDLSKFSEKEKEALRIIHLGGLDAARSPEYKVATSTITSLINKGMLAGKGLTEGGKEVAKKIAEAYHANLIGATEESSPAKTAAEELASMSDDDVMGLINQVMEERGDLEEVTPKQQRESKEKIKNLLKNGREGKLETNAEKNKRLAKPAKEAIEGVGELMKGIAEAFGIDENKLLTFPPHLDANAYAKARPHMMAAWQKFNEAGKSLKEYIQFLFDTFSKLISNFHEYAAYFVGELRGTENFEQDMAALQQEPTEEKINLDDNTGKGSKPRKQKTDEEKAAIKEKLKAREERKAKKAAMGNFQNIGFVYDPEKLDAKLKGKSEKSAVKIVLDEMVPSKIWNIEHPEGTSLGVPRMMTHVQKYFVSFKDWLLQSKNIPKASATTIEGKIEYWMQYRGGSVDQLKELAQEYAETMSGIINSFAGQTSIAGVIGRLQDVLLPGAMVDGAYPEYNELHRIPAENRHKVMQSYDYVDGHTHRMIYNFVTDTWQSLLESENDMLLSEVSVYRRGRNKTVIRSGLEDYRKDIELKSSEDFANPFGFKGVGFGEENWINQEERNRVIPAAYDAFKDLAQVLGANDKGMGLGEMLAIQFANLGHKAKGAAAAYFPSIQTVNLTRDSGDGTLAHEWGHGLHDIARGGGIHSEINSIIESMRYVYDFEAGNRMVDDLLAKDSPFLKRMVSSKRQSRIEAVKEAAKDRFMDAVRKETDYYKTSQMLDDSNTGTGITGKGYTAKGEEMWARAFEAFVYDTLKGQNNYLVGDFVAAGRVGGKSSVGTKLVYPAGLERETFNATIKRMFDGIQWDDDGTPSLKDDYTPVEKSNAALTALMLENLLGSVEDRYNAIWASEPSADGNYWYRYEATAFGPMMQPDGYIGYDKSYKEEDQDGTGAVAFSHQLHPDEILDFKLKSVQYKGESPTYISQKGGGIDGLRDDGEETLDEVSTESDSRTERGGDIRSGDKGSSGNGEGGNDRASKQRNGDDRGEGDSASGIHTAAPGNFRITDEALTDPKSVDERFLNNLSAVKILKLTEEENRSPSAEEKHILSKFSGWGGMAELFSWNPQGVWKQRQELFKSELDLQDYELSGAERASTTSYYTPVPVAQFMWRLAQRLGFERGVVLDPATGASGMFMGTMPAELEQGVALQGVEMDSLSSRIASKLYELASIDNKPFQDSKKPMNRFDLTITNVPFASLSPTDPKHNKGGHSLHNYFINKMLDLTAPGALGMMITTSNTMDKPGTHLAEFAKKADFVGAIRLPSGIYSATNVVTDILVFRKKIEGSSFAGIPADVWTTTGTDESTGLTINKYFLDHPEMVAGNLEAVTGRYGDETARVVHTGDLKRTLEDMAAAFPVSIVEREAVKDIKNIDDIVSAPGTIKEGGLYINDKGLVAQKQDGEEIVWPVATASEQKKANIARGFIGILDQVRTVLRAQKTDTDDATIKAEQAQLKALYDGFVKSFGALNAPKNLEVYADVTDASWVVALEDYDVDDAKVTRLADIFTKRIVGNQQRPDRAGSDEDALAMSLDEFGYPNPDYMARLRGTDPETVMKGLMDKVVENPETGLLETMDEYLSGNVKRKLAIARDMAKDNSEYERNVKLLEAAQPEDVPSHRITARIGASWIHPDHLADFVIAKIGFSRRRLLPVFNFNPISNEWSMSFKGPENWKGENKAQTKRDIDSVKNTVEATKVWGTKRVNFFELVKNALEGKRPSVTYKLPGDNKLYFDEVATTEAEAKLQEIQAEFGRWLFEDTARAEEAVKRFNDIINTSVPPKADGSHLTFPGKSMAVLTPKEKESLGLSIPDGTVSFYPHQMNAVWKYLKYGNLYLAHEVGAGKTMTMALAIMEARRLRGKKKPLYVTLNDSTMGQAIEEIKRLYPLANILPVRVSTNAERQRLSLQKIAMNDFDVAIMRQQDLNRIALSPEAEKVFIDEELIELREVLEEAKSNGARIQEQEIQARIQALEEKLKAPGAFADAKEKNIYFDDLGIDMIVVDEAHGYKNVPYTTRLTRITGLNPTGSATAQAFFRKTQWLNAQFPKRDAIILASGTPLTNSIAEMYNIQRMLQPQEVKRQGVWSFDRWIANFGDIGAQLEFDGAKGQYKTIVTNRKIVNAGRLLATAYQNIDSVRAKDTPIKRPVIKGGEPIGVSMQPNQYVEEYKQIILERALEYDKNPKEAEFEGKSDNMLRMISNMSKVAIDQRLDDRYANTEIQQDSKLYQSAEIIAKRWKEEKKHKGVQIVFCDLGVPKRFVKEFKYKTDEELEKLNPSQLEKYEEAKFEYENAASGKFNVYDGLKEELIKRGIPAEQIAFIHDADHSDKKKKEAKLRALYKKVNDGEIRVLLGSTSKAGTGVNVQRRVSDIHHLDIWWNYSAWEQRNGRAIRAGNIYADLEGVNIYNYITETTVDATRWDKVFAKGKVLNAVLGGDINLDVIEDISESTMSAKQMAAMASGDPLMAQHADLLQKVQLLKIEQAGYLDMVRQSKMELAQTPGKIDTRKARIESYQKSRKVMEAVTAVRFVGDDRTLVLEKHGKEIAEALEKAVEANTNSWAAEKTVPLLVFGTHTEKEVVKSVDGKDKKTKEYTFHPVAASANITGQHGDPFGRRLDLVGDILGSDRKLADIKEVGKKKQVSVNANISRTVTEYLSWLDKGEETAKSEIAELEANKPKLEKLVETQWQKTEQLADSDKQLKDIERKMAGKGEFGGDPETGIPYSKYKGPIPVLEDIAEKSDWALDNGIYYPRQSYPDVAIKTQSEMKSFLGNRQGAFNPKSYGRYNIPYDLEALDGGKPETPKYGATAFTIINGDTRIWVGTDMTVDPVQWQLVERVVGKSGSWHYAQLPGSGDEALVHVTTDGVRDAFVRVRRESFTPKGVKSLLSGDKYSRASSKTKGQTADSLRAAFNKLVNWRKMEASGVFRIVQTAAELPEGAKPDAKGMFTTKGNVYFVADNIPAGEELGLLLHEVGVHYGLEGMIGPELFASVMKQIQTLKKANPAIREAYKLVPADTKAENINEEALGYLMEIKPDAPLVKRVIAAIKAFLFKHGFLKAERLNDNDLVALAQASLKKAEKGNGSQRMAPAFNMASLIAKLQPFYSKLEQAIPKMGGRMPYDQLVKMLKGQQVTDAEIEQLIGGLKDKGVVTKQDVLDEIAANTIEFQDVVLGEGGEKLTEDGFPIENEDGSFVENLPTHFSQYTEPGAVEGSYREMFVTVPPQKPKQITTLPDGYDTGVDYSQPDGKKYHVTAPGQISARPFAGRHATREEAIKAAIEVINDFSTHLIGKWQDGHSQYSSIQNPIVRIRFNERTVDGKRILFVEEMQGASDANQQKMPDYLRKRIYDIGVKRVLAYAKENGFGGVAWTTGEMQANRYDLSKHLSAVEWTLNPKQHKRVRMIGLHGELIMESDVDTETGKIVSSRHEGDALESVIGKEVAAQVMASGKGSLSGLDLKVGGEGLKSLYDKTLPALFKKYGGEAVGKVGLDYEQKLPKGWTSYKENGEWLVDDENGTTQAISYSEEDAIRKAISRSNANAFTVPYVPITAKTPASYPMFSNSAKTHLYGYNNDRRAFYERVKIPDYHRSYFERGIGTADELLRQLGLPVTAEEADQIRAAGDGKYLRDATAGSDVAPVELKYPYRYKPTYSASKEKYLVADGVPYLLNMNEHEADAKLGRLHDAFAQSDSSPYYSRADHEAVKAAREALKSMEFNVDGLTKFLAMPANFIKRNISPQVRQIINDWISPIPAQAERDPNKKPFLATGSERQRERVKINMAFYKGGEVTFDDVHEALNKLSKQEQAQFDKLLVEGDVKGKVFASLEEALKVKALAGTSAKAFAAYQTFDKFRNHVTDQMVREFEASLLLSGQAKAVADDKIAKYRQQVKELIGYIPRKREEGSFAVTAYRHVTDLFHNSSDAVYIKDKDDEIAGIKMNIAHPGVELTEKVKELAAEYKVRVREGGGRIGFEFRGGEQKIGEVWEEGFMEALEELNEEIRQSAEDGKPYLIKQYQQFYETEGKADDALGKLQADPKAHMPHNYSESEEYTYKREFNDKISEEVYQETKDLATEQVVLQALSEAARKGSISKEDAAELKQSTVEHLSYVMLERGAGRHQIRRAPYLIEGYATDNVFGTYLEYLSGLAGMISKSRYAFRQMENLTDEKIAKPEVKGWAFKYVAEQLRNMGKADRIAGDARAIASLFYLGYKLSSAFLNATQPYILGQAELSRYVKNGSPTAMMVKAERDVLEDWAAQRAGRNSTLKADEAAFLKDHRDEIETSTIINDMTGQIEMNYTGTLSKHLHGMMGSDKWFKPMWLFNKVETLNRETSALAAYRVFRDQGMGSTEAAQKAVEFSNTVNFEAGRHAAPHMANKPLGRALFTLQSFTFNALHWAWNRGTSGDKAQVMALARAVAAIIAIGGIAAIPGGDDLDKLLMHILGKSYKQETREWTHKHAKEFGSVGEAIDNMLWHGGTSLAGVNISNALSVRLPILSTLLDSKSPTEGAAGIWGGLWNKGMMAGRNFDRGNYSRAAESLAPEFIASPMRAIRQATEGMTTTGGRPVLDEDGKPQRYSALDAAKRSLGFQPLDQSGKMETARTGHMLSSMWGEQRQELLDRFRMADDAEAIRSARQRIMKWNKSLNESQARGLVKPITSESMTRARTTKPDKKKMQWQREHNA